MRCFLVIIGLFLAMSACREKPSAADCRALAKRQVSQPTDRGDAKIEYEARFEACMSDWSKEEAQCAAKSRNRNQFISCR